MIASEGDTYALLGWLLLASLALLFLVGAAYAGAGTEVDRRQDG